MFRISVVSTRSGTYGTSRMSLRLNVSNTTSCQAFSRGASSWGGVGPLADAIEFSPSLATPRLDAIPGIVNMPDHQHALRRGPMPPLCRRAMEEETRISGNEGSPKMSVNNKRVFYVKYLAHEIYADILRARPDLRLDRLENESAQEVAGARLSAAPASHIR